MVVGASGGKEHSARTEGGAQHLGLARSHALVELVRTRKELDSLARFAKVLPERN